MARGSHEHLAEREGGSEQAREKLSVIGVDRWGPELVYVNT